MLGLQRLQYNKQKIKLERNREKNAGTPAYTRIVLKSTVLL
jgi:hypothetical protein